MTDIQADIQKLQADLNTLSADLATTSNSTTTSTTKPKIAPVAIYPGYKSATIVCPVYPGVVDWRVCPSPDDTECKYAGGIPVSGSAMIQVNGIPDEGAYYTLDGVDCLGPYMPMLPPGTAQAGSGMTSINGHGASTSVPKEICTSDPIFLKPITYVAPTGLLWLFDGDNFTEFVDVPSSRVVQDVSFRIRKNNTFQTEDHGTMLANTSQFISHRHLHTITRAGEPTAPDEANCSLLMSPVDSSGNVLAPDISTGKTLHISWTAVPHVNDRLWVELLLTRAGSQVVNGGKFDADDGGNNYFTDGDGFCIRFKPSQMYLLHVLQNGKQVVQLPKEPYFSNFAQAQQLARCWWWKDNQGSDDQGRLYAKGFDQNHDRQNQFDLYINKAGYRFVEKEPTGRVWIDYSGTWPASGLVLPDKLNIYWRHGVYHPLLVPTEQPASEVLWHLKTSLGDYTDLQHWNFFAVSLE